jgi:tripartite-type tricarboxylate transporter receptor subunit TctC
MIKQRYFARLLAVLLASLAATAPAQEVYPNRPIKLIVPLGPGSATDALTRVMAEALTHELNGTLVVENKPGAAGAIGANFVAKAAPDGYTIGVFHSSVLTAAAAINPKLPYDPRKDFTPIAIVASNPIVLAVPANSRYKTLDEFVDAARKEPGKHTTGFIGIGSHSQFNLELLNMASGAKISAIPYAQGSGPLLNGLLGGEIESGSAVWATFAGQVAGGKLRLLATAAPLKELPDVPTFADRGYKKANMEVLMVVVAPPQLPKAIADRLSQAVERILKDPKTAQRIESQGLLVRYGDSRQLAGYLAEETALLTDVAAKSGIKAE